MTDRLTVPVYNKPGGIRLGDAVFQDLGSVPGRIVIVVPNDLIFDEMIQLHQFGMAYGLRLDVITEPARPRHPRPEEFGDIWERIRKETEKSMDEAGRQEQAHITAEIRTELARKIVFGYVKDIKEKTDDHVKFEFSDVYVVWFTSVLRNWKALVSTQLPDGMYYEVTYDGEKNRVYLDAYKKWENAMFFFDENGNPYRVWTKPDDLVEDSTKKWGHSLGRAQGVQIGNNSNQTNTWG